jgi:SAM-dependent methyltransferase
MTAETPLRSMPLPTPPPVDPATDPYAAHLLDLVLRTTDRSSWSDELALAAPTWPDSYHLHPSRANVLRTLPLPADAAILELGARAGGLTRYLGENAATVDALELDPALAAVAAARCAGLDGVHVRLGWIDAVPDHSAYDVVVAIDVLAEIADHDMTLEAFVTRCRSLLRPGGLLVMAADNSVPVPDGRATTIAAGDLESAVRAAGLVPATLSAFPDHRHTQLLFSPTRLAELSPVLVTQLPKFALPPAAPTFVEAGAQQRLWSSSVAEGTADTRANSVVVLAASTEPALADAATFWSIGRAASQSACNRVRVQDGEPVVIRARAYPRAPEPDAPLRLRPHTEPVVDGISVSHALAQETSVARARDLLVRWTDFVRSWSDGDADVPWDLIPRNVLVLDDGSMAAIDQEWHLDGATAELVLARGWFWLAEELVSSPTPPPWLARGTVARTADVLRGLSAVAPDPFWLEELISREADQAAYVAPSHPGHSHAFQARKNRGALMALSRSGDNQPASTPQSPSGDAEESAALRALVASLTEENEALRERVRALELDARHVAMIHRDHVLGLDAELETIRERWRIAQQSLRRAKAKNTGLQKELTAMRQSTTWRVGRRVIAPIARLRGSSAS